MIHFDMQAPHGARVYPTMTGLRIEIPDNMRDIIGKWLQDEAVRYGQTVTEEEELVVCPKCNGKLEMRNGIPVFCTLCHGRMKVSKTAAEGYTASLSQPQTVVRQQASLPPAPPVSPHDQLRAVLNQQQHPVAIPLQQLIVVDGKELHPGESIATTSPDTDEGEFIGPIQQKPA